VIFIAGMYLPFLPPASRQLISWMHGHMLPQKKSTHASNSHIIHDWGLTTYKNWLFATSSYNCMDRHSSNGLELGSA